MLDAAQALCVALPAAGLPAFLRRLTGRGWALLAPVSLVVTIGAIGVTNASADVLTWIALLLVPLGCALALGWAAHGARPWLALAALPCSRPRWRPRRIRSAGSPDSCWSSDRASPSAGCSPERRHSDT